MRTLFLAFLIFVFGFGFSLDARELNISRERGPFFNYQRYFVLHHTEFSAAEFPSQFDIVNRYHRDQFREDPSVLGWNIGYTLFCERDGTLIQARLIGEKSAAQLGHNYDSISLCFAGDYDNEYLTKAQVETLREVLLVFQDYEFMFHREIAGDDRSCPGWHITRKGINALMREEWVAKQATIYERNHPKKKILRIGKSIKRHPRRLAY